MTPPDGAEEECTSMLCVTPLACGAGDAAQAGFRWTTMHGSLGGAKGEQGKCKGPPKPTLSISTVTCFPNRKKMGLRNPYDKGMLP